MKIISKTLKIQFDKLDINYIENEIKKENITPLRWAITEVKNNKLTISVSGIKN